MRRARVAVALAAVFVACTATAGQAQTGTARGPMVALERPELAVGQRVVVTLTGWKTRHVTLAVCGNLARRGSGDCNMVASQAVRLTNSPAPTLTELVVFAPPGTCPCVVRASSVTQDEVFLAPVVLLGVAVGPVVGPSSASPVEVATRVEAAGEGIVGAVRTTLGGPSSYRLTVSVRNVSAETLANITLAGSAGRSRTDTAVSFDIPQPGPLAPGEIWEHHAFVTLPAPVLSPMLWRVAVSGAGEPVSAESITSRMPVGLLILIAILLTDVVAIAWRVVARRRQRHHGPHSGDASGSAFQERRPLLLVPPVAQSEGAVVDSYTLGRADRQSMSRPETCLKR